MRRKHKRIAKENIAVKTDVYHNTSMGVVNVTTVINKLSLKTINDLAKNIADIKRVEWNGNSQYSIIAYNENAADELIEKLNATESKRRIAKESWLSDMTYDDDGAKWTLKDDKDLNDFIRALALFQEQNPRYEVEFDGSQLTMDSSKVVAQEFETEFNAMERRLRRNINKVKKSMKSKQMSLEAMKFIGEAEDNLGYKFAKKYTLGNLTEAAIDRVFTKLNQEDNDAGFELEDDTITILADDKSQFDRAYAMLFAASEKRKVAKESINLQEGSKVILKVTKDFVKQLSQVDDSELFDKFADKFIGKHVQAEVLGSYTLQDKSYVTLNVVFDNDYDLEIDLDYVYFNALVDAGTVSFESKELPANTQLTIVPDEAFIDEMINLFPGKRYALAKSLGKPIKAVARTTDVIDNKSYLTIDILLFSDPSSNISIQMDEAWFNELVVSGVIAYESKRVKVAKENKAAFYLTLIKSATVTTSNGEELVSRTYRTNDNRKFADFIQKNSDILWIENVNLSEVEVRAYNDLDFDRVFKKLNISVEQLTRRKAIAKENLQYVADYDVFDRFNIQKEYETDLKKGEIIRVMRYLDDEGFVFDIDILDDSIVVMADDQATFDIVVDKLNEA